MARDSFGIKPFKIEGFGLSKKPKEVLEKMIKTFYISEQRKNVKAVGKGLINRKCK